MTERSSDMARRYNALSWPTYLGAFISLVVVAAIVWWVA